jgi:hypothetical protein
MVETPHSFPDNLYYGFPVHLTAIDDEFTGTE